MSNDVAYMKPSCFCSISVIFGRGYGLLLKTLFNSLRSANNQSDPFGLEIVNCGHAHSELFVFLKTPYLHCLAIPFFLESREMDKIWHGMAFDWGLSIPLE